MDRYRRTALLSGLSLLLPACAREEQVPYAPAYGARPVVQDGPKKFLLGVHPLHNPGMLFKLYGPLVDHLNHRIPAATFALEASKNYEDYDRKLAARRFDLALPNPYQTIMALRHGYRVFGKMGDDHQFRGLILVRQDSAVQEVRDLADANVSFPAKTALAATMLPQRYLHDHGLKLSAYRQKYVGSQESSIMNVFLNETLAGATWPPPWAVFQREYPERAAQLRVFAETETLPNNSLMVRDDFPEALLASLATVLFTLQAHETGRDILARLPLSRFEPATTDTYAPVQTFIGRFEREVLGQGGTA